MRRIRQTTAGKALNLNGRLIELQVSKFDHQGQGIGWFEGKTVFVAGAMPGETVRAKVTDHKKTLVWATVESVLSASPERLEPKCQLFGQCGGCTLQHVPHETQVNIKQAALADQLQRLARLQPQQWLQPLISPRSERYRSRVKLLLKDGVVGYSKSRSHMRVPVTDCVIGDFVWPDILENLKQLPLKQAEIEIGSAQGLTAHLMLKTRPSHEQLKQLSLVLSGFCDYFEISLEGQPLTESGQQQPEYLLLVRGREINIAFKPSHFTQVNREVNQALVTAVMNELKPGSDDLILDLFAGSGNFSLPVACYGAQVFAFEGSDDLVLQGRQNAEHNGLNVGFETLDLFDESSIAMLQQKQANKLLLDPPRSGAKLVCESMSELKPELIVYISCNPATLARDAGILAEQGYLLTKAGVLDMFPHTAHVESMAVFVKAGPKKTRR